MRTERSSDAGRKKVISRTAENSGQRASWECRAKETATFAVRNPLIALAGILVVLFFSWFFYRSLFAVLFLAPLIVSNAKNGAVFCAKLFENYGYDTFPKFSDQRSDIIQSVGLNSKEEIISFCRGIQKAAPVDSFVTPEPWAMPGYDSEVIMAAGAFIQGSSIELSADAPIKEPFTVYFQGGLTYEHSKIGARIALSEILKHC